MKLISASILLLGSIYLFALPQFIAQVSGATLSSIGFILIASETLGSKKKRQPHFMSGVDIQTEYDDYGDYWDERDEIHEQSKSFRLVEAVKYSDTYEIHS